ncbi:hypothetical protein GQR58_026737 [Nymphon striatum]|nr:hypothetical protein GQR58_026737 [Nymphon striatum]
MDKFRPPDQMNFDGNIAENWRKWSQRFKLYLVASGAYDKPEEVQVAILLTSIGENGIEIYNNFKFDNEASKNNLKVIIEKFDDYCNPRKNTVFERYTFWQLTQGNKSIDQYVTELNSMSRNCEFGNQCDLMIRDRIVFGTNDDQVRERLLRDSDLSLQSAIDICRAAEASRAQIKTLKEARGETCDVHTFNSTSKQKIFDRTRTFPKTSRAPPPPNTLQTTPYYNNCNSTKSVNLDNECPRCGYSHDRNSCPALGKRCTYCNIPNHFVKVCRKKQADIKKQVHYMDCDIESDNETRINNLFIGEIVSKQRPGWYTNLSIGNENLTFKLDTGAEANTISYSSFITLQKKIPYLKLLKTNVKLSAYGNSKVKPAGICMIDCYTMGKSEKLEFFVVDIKAPHILGLSACKSLNLVKRIDVINSNDINSPRSLAEQVCVVTKDEIIKNYKDVFEGLGEFEGDHHIEIDPSVKPVIHAPRKVAYSILPKLKETLQSLVERGVIVKEDSPTDWVNSLVIVEKRSSNKLRICLDPRDLNAAIKRERFRIPTPDDIHSQLSGKTVFTILDEKDGFWHIKLDEQSSKLCTFNTPFGRLQRLLLRTQKYDLIVTYHPGKYMYLADTLSRAPDKSTNTSNDGMFKNELDDDVLIHTHTLISNLSVSPHKLQEIKQIILDDKDMKTLKQYIHKGWPHHRRNIPISIRQYWSIREEVYEADDLLLVGEKLLVPWGLRKQILDQLHESHTGIEKCKSRAREVYYWPGMSRDIENMITKCSTCAQFRRNNQKEPLLPHPVPDRPWQRVGADIMTLHGKDYLVVVDYFSKFPELCLISDKTARTVITHLKSTFARHGIPEVLVADNMPFLSTNMKEFAHNWDFLINTSSPTYSQSNGQSERMIQTIKNLLKKAHADNRDPYVALMEYRNTAISGMEYSPAQLLMSRMLKTKLPVLSRHLRPRIVDGAQAQLMARQNSYKNYYDKSAKHLPPIHLHDGVRVRTRNEWQPAMVTGVHAAPRSYIVTTSDGSRLRRNRRHLLKTREYTPASVGTPLQHKVPQPRPEREVSRSTEGDSTMEARNETSPTAQPHITFDGECAESMNRSESIDIREANLPTAPYDVIQQSAHTSSGRRTKTPHKYKDYVMD